MKTAKNILVAFALGLSAVALSGCSCSDESDSPAGAECTPGAESCECRNGTECDNGLACSGGVCVAATQSGVVVSDPNARGCEVLLVEQGSKIQAVDFGQSVRGTYVREAPKVSLSFISTTDVAITGISVSMLGGAGGAGATAPTVQSVSCVDRSAQPLADATVTLQ